MAKFKKILKKVAPLAAFAIPGVGGLLGKAVGGLVKGGGALLGGLGKAGSALMGGLGQAGGGLGNLLQMGGGLLGDYFSERSARKQEGHELDQLTDYQNQMALLDQRISDLSRMTPQEIEREHQTFELEKRRLPILEARAGKSGEQLLRESGGISNTLLDQIAAETKDPYATYQSTLEPELELARQMVNQEANRRGVFGGQPQGGIRFENLGRASVDLAIKSARERMNYRNQALNRAENIMGRGLTEQTGARGEVGNLLGDLERLSEVSRQRQYEGGMRGAEMLSGAAETGLGVQSGISRGRASRYRKAGESFGRFGAEGAVNLLRGFGRGRIPTSGGINPNEPIRLNFASAYPGGY